MSSMPSMTGPLRHGSERRRHSRYRILEKQLVTVDLGSEHRGLLVDVSVGGMAVQPYVPLQTGDTSTVRFHVPGESQQVEAEGVVTWVGPSGRTGIRFDRIAEAGQHSLLQWIDGMSGPAGISPPHAVYSTAAYLPPSYSPWIKIGDVRVDSSPLPDDIAALDLVSALRLVVERARSVTRATGAAIALADAGDMVCRARTGIAPDLGARFRPDSGLSGEAVRTGNVVICNEAATDARVDQAACQRLNVRSIVIQPVLLDKAVIGVIEAFSAKSEAFEERDVINLRRLAELVSAMLEGGVDASSSLRIDHPGGSAQNSISDQPRASEPAGATVELASQPATPVLPEGNHAPVSEVGEQSANSSEPTATAVSGGERTEAATSALPIGDATAAQESDAPRTVPSIKEINDLYDRFTTEAEQEDQRKRAKVILSLVLLAALGAGSFAGANWWSRRQQRTAPLPATTVAQSPSLLPVAVNTGPSVQPVSLPAPAAAITVSPKKAVRREQEMIAENWVWSAPTKAGTGSELKQQESDVPPPEVQTIASAPEQSNAMKDLLASGGHSQPELQTVPRLSHVTEGKLIARVNPILPAMVTTSGLHGQVVVKIAIGKGGKVEKAHLLNGNAVLGAAAVQAVSKWRYEPYRLNGEPVAVEKIITINFADPHRK